eukprot:CAMPEP_0185732718 /NCGR_PEP_ID=MMETSP1171-20130828/17297_1 /TAXON_ID=374046 /ORGANISM="Helicotheca tamensis, Strain CCMP826" /LENGTH=493 /DNA_ID=CAMNT_0028402285 /DNA_START=39 /DNA_END=1520 /DNA_ORIENTATION=+
MMVMALSVSSFVVKTESHRRTRSAAALLSRKTKNAMLVLQSSNGSNEKESSMKGKTVYRRYVYYVSPESDMSHSYSIEERTAYKFNDNNELVPLNNKRSFIVRNPPPMDDGVLPPPEDQKRKDAKGFVRLGDKLCQVDVTLDDEQAITTNAEIAMVMYLISNKDKALHGDIAQIETEVGTGLISALSALAAGHLLSDNNTDNDNAADPSKQQQKQEQSDDDILPHPETPAPIPEKLSKISLFTNPSNPNSFKTVLQTLKNSSIDPSKLSIQNLNPLKPSSSKETTSSSSSLSNSQNLILATDLITQFPDIAPLSKFIAYTLKPTPYDRSTNDIVVDDGGYFYHLSPIHRDVLVDFKKKLSMGYRMNVSNDYIKIMQFDLVPWIHDDATAPDENEEGGDDDDDNTKKEEETNGEMGIQGYVQFHSQSSEEYTVLKAVHDENYTGENGEYFFPVELGYDENGGYGSTDVGGTVGKEVEKDVGYKGGPGDGRWLDF